MIQPTHRNFGHHELVLGSKGHRSTQIPGSKLTTTFSEAEANCAIRQGSVRSKILVLIRTDRGLARTVRMMQKTGVMGYPAGRLRTRTGVAFVDWQGNPVIRLCSMWHRDMCRTIIVALALLVVDCLPYREQADVQYVRGTVSTQYCHSTLRLTITSPSPSHHLHVRHTRGVALPRNALC